MEWIRLMRGIPHLAGIVAGVLPLIATANIGHLSDSNCATCHVAGESANEYSAHLLTASQEVLCGGCHENSLYISHPSGFVPDRHLPIEYPLDWDGIFTCSSCHSIHASTPGLLRDNTAGQSLCLTCHEAAFFSQMADDGLSIVQIHLTLQPIDPALPVDSYSLHCAGCHDNVISANGDGSFNASNDSGMNHTIGVNYNNFTINGRYFTIAELDSRMVLPYGYISCVSCHQGYSSDHGNLNVLKTGSALCYQCHNM